MLAGLRRICIVAGVLAPLAGIAMLGAGRGAPVAEAPAAVRELWIPPGTYTGIVFVTTAQQRRWVAALCKENERFPVTLGPGATVVIPFERGWEVRPEDRARVIVDGVVARVPTDAASLMDEGAIAISAWGITPNGPVQFVVR